MTQWSDLHTPNGDIRAVIATPGGEVHGAAVVLHAWWGLTEFFTAFCDRLADEGYVAVAPDLYGGRIASTIEEAEQLVGTVDPSAAGAAIERAVATAQTHAPDKPVALIGFSMGVSYAFTCAEQNPDAVGAIVAFYGAAEPAVTNMRAAVLGHFAADDPWEPREYIDALERALRDAGRDVTFYTYPDSGHWFMEDNRTDAFNPDAAALAWQRTLEFLRRHI